MTKSDSVCNKCGTLLSNDNWYPSCKRDSYRICKTCIKERSKQYYIKNREHYIEYSRDRRYSEGAMPMGKNRSCSLFLGICVAEEVLCKMFEDVIQMPYGNSGYDFVCNKGKKIDVKSSTTRLRKGRANSWQFRIDKNTTADFYICIAFDNIHNIEPLHVWMIPGTDINNHVSISVSTTTINKWDKYRLDINKVVACCDTMKGGNV